MCGVWCGRGSRGRQDGRVVWPAMERYAHLAAEPPTGPPWFLVLPPAKWCGSGAHPLVPATRPLWPPWSWFPAPAMAPCPCPSTHPRSLSRLPHHRPREAKRRARRQNGARLATSRTNLPFWVVWALESGNICPDEFVNTKSLQSPTRPLSTTQGFPPYCACVLCYAELGASLVVWLSGRLIHLPSPALHPSTFCAPRRRERKEPAPTDSIRSV